MRGLLHLSVAVVLGLALATVSGSCACNETKKGGTTTNHPPSDAGAGPVVGNAKACDDAKPKVESLYRAAAREGDKNADQAVADNTAMVLRDCRTSPAKFAACIQGALDVAALERDCIIPLDDEGRVEGRAFGGK